MPRVQTPDSSPEVKQSTPALEGRRWLRPFTMLIVLATLVRRSSSPPPLPEVDRELFRARQAWDRQFGRAARMTVSAGIFGVLAVMVVVVLPIRLMQWAASSETAPETWGDL